MMRNPSGCWSVALGVGRADAGTGAAADAAAGILHDHDLALDLIIIFFFEIHECAVFINTGQGHDVPAADLEAAAAADADLGVDAEEILRLPGAAGAG